MHRVNAPRGEGLHKTAIRHSLLTAAFLALDSGRSTNIAERGRFQIDI
jgi:hypothetical protein